MAEGDLYQVRFRQEFDGENIDNNMAYLQTDLSLGMTPAQELAEAWFGQFAPVMSVLQNQNCLYQYVDVFNVADSSDNYRLNVTGAVINNGTTTDQPYGEWEAHVFSKTPVNRDFKSGLFRLRGLDETTWDGKTLNPTLADEVEDLRLAINDIVTGTNGSIWQPVILRKVRNPLDTSLPFVNWVYSHTLASGVVYLGRGHKVNNQ